MRWFLPARMLDWRVPVFGLVLGALIAAVACGDRLPPAAPGPPPSEQRYAADGAPLGPVRRPARPPNLIVLLVDTLRADAAGAGPGEGVMPGLSAWGEGAVGFTQASTPAAWTIPSVATLLTGLLPHEHGCVDHVQTPRLLESVVTYAEVLGRAYGYETAAFTDAPWFRGSTGSLLQGFHTGSAGPGARLSRSQPTASGYWLAGTPAVLSPWLAARDPARPFFLLLHTFDAHDPYGERNHMHRQAGDAEVWARHDRQVAAYDARALRTPVDRLVAFLTDGVARGALMRTAGDSFLRDVSDAMWSEFRDGANAEVARRLHEEYRAGARWVDSGLTGALAWLKEQGLLENTLLVVTADHGEAFAEHGTVGHGHHLHDELVRVPLWFSGPGPFARPETHEVSVGLIDVLPTFFDWAGLTDIPQRHGRSLLPLIEGRTREGHPVHSEAVVRGGMASPGVDRYQVAVRTEAWKYVVTLDRTSHAVTEALYDLRADPEERADLLARAALDLLPLGESFCAAVDTARRLIHAERSALGEVSVLAGARARDSVTLWEPAPTPCDEFTPR